MRILERLRWKAKQRLAGSSRFYGDGGTIHSSGYLDVETREGMVVAVWFRCQVLPFKQTAIDEHRATEMARMRRNSPAPVLTGVEVTP
jgi:hypothetical protein